MRTSPAGIDLVSAGCSISTTICGTAACPLQTDDQIGGAWRGLFAQYAGLLQRADPKLSGYVRSTQSDTSNIRANNASPARPLLLVRKSCHAPGGEESAAPSISAEAGTAARSIRMAGGGC